MNKVILIGRLTRDPELRYTQSNTAVCTFTLAIDKKLSREKREEAEAAGRPTADFPRIIVWGKMGENASRYLEKGKQCAIEGRIQTGSYKDSESGKTVYTTDIIAENVEFLTRVSEEKRNDGRGRNTYQNNSGGSEEFFGDDFKEIEDQGRIPF